MPSWLKSSIHRDVIVWCVLIKNIQNWQNYRIKIMKDKLNQCFYVKRIIKEKRKILYIQHQQRLNQSSHSKQHYYIAFFTHSIVGAILLTFYSKRLLETHPIGALAVSYKSRRGTWFMYLASSIKGYRKVSFSFIIHNVVC